MDTDRVNHYVWNYQHDPSSPHYKFFRDFYMGIDTFLGQICERLPKDAELVILSDHGFCDLNWEVQLNRWLRDKGYLDYENAPEKHYQAVKPGSRALALVPGRIHILTKAKWRKGTVTESDYGPLRNEIVEQLKELRDPSTGDLMCKKVLTRDELYSGPCFNRAHDIIIDPVEGYDFKATLGEGPLLDKGVLKGMHTYWDAMLLTTSGLPDIATSQDITEVGIKIEKHYLG